MQSENLESIICWANIYHIIHWQKYFLLTVKHHSTYKKSQTSCKDWCECIVNCSSNLFYTLKIDFTFTSYVLFIEILYSSTPKWANIAKTRYSEC